MALQQLNDKAPIICTGTVAQVTVSDQKGQLQWLSNAPLPTRIVIAKIKILHAFRGEVGSEIEIRYPNFDWQKIKGFTGIGFMPYLIDLSVGKRYRFYLRPVANQPWYVSAYPNELEGGVAVQEIATNEKDSDAALLESEAVQIATQYLEQRKPSFHVSPQRIIASYRTSSRYNRCPRWTVEFFEKKPLDYPPFTYGAEIVVDSDRTIDFDSWIAMDPPPEDRAKLAGKFVRVLYQPPNDGGVYIVRGHVAQVTDNGIVLSLSKTDLDFQISPDHPVDSMKISSKELRGVSVLLE
jgi:hypothetical protein